MTPLEKKALDVAQNNRPYSTTNTKKFSTPIDEVLGLLSKVIQRQPGQWSARCPAHDDRGPSLSVRETSEHAVLLHCFAGCTVHDITTALSLNLADLFPLRESMTSKPKRIPRLLTASQAMQLLRQEAMLTLVAASNLAKGWSLTDQEYARLLTAVGRIEYIFVESLGARHA